MAWGVAKRCRCCSVYGDVDEAGLCIYCQPCPRCGVTGSNCEDPPPFGHGCEHERFARMNDRIWGERNWMFCDECTRQNATGHPVWHHVNHHAP